MGASRQKKTLFAIIIICLILAGFITYQKNAAYKKKEAAEQTGIESIPPGEKTWIKCSNPDCKAEYQIPKREYFENIKQLSFSDVNYLMPYHDPNAKPTPPVTCNVCGKEDAYRAEKCQKCGLIFDRGTVRIDFVDRCPDCGFSKIEADRKAARDAKDDEP